MNYPVIVADRLCPTWSRLTWWDKLLRRKPHRVVFRMPDGVLICSQDTKDFYERSLPIVIPYQESR